MVPYIKYYIEENPEADEPRTAKIPTREEYEQYYEQMEGYAPGKAIQTYEKYVERQLHEESKITKCKSRLSAVTINENNKQQIVAGTESQKGFIQWM